MSLVKVVIGATGGVPAGRLSAITIFPGDSKEATYDYIRYEVARLRI
jgi:hypothetical protein